MKQKFMMEDNMKELLKELSDIALVAYLACKDYKIKEIRKDKEKSWFCFDETDELEKEIMTFLNRDAVVDPLRFSETLRNLKSLARQGRT
jgi:hypothetical protein